MPDYGEFLRTMSNNKDCISSNDIQLHNYCVQGSVEYLENPWHTLSEIDSVI